MDNIIITFEDGTKKEYRKGIKLEEIIKDVAPADEIICVSFNNSIINYSDSLNRSGTLFLHGIKVDITIKIAEIIIPIIPFKHIIL